jgi:hypothetical protein
VEKQKEISAQILVDLILKTLNSEAVRSETVISICQFLKKDFGKKTAEDVYSILKQRYNALKLPEKLT